jgi:hypothetical protein
LDSADPPAEYSFVITSDEANIQARQDLTWTGQLTVTETETVVSGEIHNPGADLSDAAELVVTFYDPNGAVVAVGSDAIFGGDLPSGQSAPFNIAADGAITAIATFTVLVMGY